MGDYDSYNAYLSITPTTHTNYYKELSQQTLNNIFDLASDVYTIKHGTTDIKARVMEFKQFNSTDNLNVDDNYRKLTFQNLDYVVNLGDYFTFFGSTWITIDVSLPSVLVRKSNHNLKWQISDGTIKEYPCVVTNKVTSVDGTAEDRFMSLPAGRFNIILPYNMDTKLLTRNKRFIIDNKAWIVTFDNAVTMPGLMQLTVSNDGQVIGENDNLILGIADYVEMNYVVTILNGNTFDLVNGNTIQLNTLVTDNGVEVQNPSVVYGSSDEDIATVDVNGLVTSVDVGTVTISATYLGVSDSITINIVSAPIIDNYTLEIVGDSSITQNSSKIFTAKLYNNGSPVAIQPTTWQISNSTIAVITSENNSECTIKGIKIGSVVLTCTLDSDPLVSVNKNINITSLW